MKPRLLVIDDDQVTRGLLTEVLQDEGYDVEAFESGRIALGRAADRDFDLVQQRSYDNIVGLEYESCCWAIRTVLRRYLKDRDGDYRDGIYLEMNLKGLARVGSGTRDLF